MWVPVAVCRLSELPRPCYLQYEGNKTRCPSQTNAVNQWPGICWRHTACAKHSVGCLCRCWRTTCRSRQTWVTGRSCRADEADTCQAWSGAEPPRCCSPCWNQHDKIVRKIRRNFLLVFYSDLGSMWKQYQVKSTSKRPMLSWVFGRLYVSVSLLYCTVHVYALWFCCTNPMAYSGGCWWELKRPPSLSRQKKKFHHAMLLAFAFSALMLLVGRQGNGRASGL